VNGPRAGRARGSGAAATASLFALAAGLHALVLRNLPLVPKNDSVSYLGLTHGVARQQVFDPYSLADPTVFDVHYTMGYPLFLDLVRSVAGWDGLAHGVVVVQAALGVASVLVLHRLGVAIGRPAAGWIAALAWCLYFPRAYYGQLMISETLFTFLALAGAWALAPCLARPTTARLLAASATLGLATVVRPVAAFEAAAFGALLALWPGAGSIGERARRVALLGLVPVALLAANVAHNRVLYGRAVLNDVSGRHWIDRLWAFDHTVVPTGPATAEVVAACRRSGEGFHIPGEWWDFWKALRHGSGLDAPAADALLARAARESLAADPVRYVVRTPLALWRLLAERDDWLPPLEQTVAPDAFAHYLERWTADPADPARAARSLRAAAGRRDFLARVPIAPPEGGPHPRAWLLLWRDLSPSYAMPTAVAFLLGVVVLVRLGRRRDWVPVLMVAALLAPAALLEQPYGRYRQPATPAMLLVIAGAGLACVRRVRDAREREPGDAREREPG